MKVPLQILHLEDDVSDAELLRRKLKAQKIDCVITCVKTERDFEAALETGSFDVILSDHTLPGFDGFSALKRARQKCPDIPFIFVSGTIGEEKAVESLKEGATDYVIKDRLSRVASVIERALRDAAAQRKRLQAEEQIREQAALLDLAQDAICLNDMDQKILYWNKGAERIYGWRASEAVSRNANELLFQGDLAASIAALKSLIREGVWHGELQQVTKNGHQIIVESRWVLSRNSRGEPRGILVTNTDITERKRIEAQLLRTQRVESVGALAGGIAHDLNNALTPILIGVTFLRGETLSAEGAQMVDLMETSARHGVDMVKQILSFSRGVGGHLTTVSIRNLVNEMAKLARKTFPRSIDLQVHIAGNLDSVIGNATQLHQVLLNLCLNARDAMTNGGTLTIAAENVVLAPDNIPKECGSNPGPYVHLKITDTGHGMPPETLKKIFEPFFTTKASGSGTGLGLSTAIGIVKTHGGFVDVQSEVGRGTIFSVFLPGESASAHHSSATLGKSSSP